MSLQFLPKEPTEEDCWRAIILLGRNTASYKFALAKTLLEIQPSSGQLVKLSYLAPIYVRHITEHLNNVDRQGVFSSSKFLDGLRKLNKGELSENEAIELAIRYGFNNVIDAFHVVGQEDTPKKFYIDERKENKGIRVTDEFSRLIESKQFLNLPKEVESRWRLVETAWELGINNNLLSIDYESEAEHLFALDKSKRRKPVTKCRDALNGYQKGKCFYCFSDIKLGFEGDQPPDVDHFFPHVLKHSDIGVNIDGVWNLVLSCKECNRGSGGKFEQLPSLRLLERLNTRNNFLISSHHPLRETLIKQTGDTEAARTSFLNKIYERAWAKLISRWEPKEKNTPLF